MQVYGEDSYQPQQDKEHQKAMYAFTTLDCLLLFLIGSVGLFIFANFVFPAILDLTSLRITAEKGTELYSTQTTAYLTWDNFLAYLLLLPILLLMRFFLDKEGFKNKAKAFTFPHTYLYVFYALMMMLVLGTIWGYIDQVITAAAGLKSSTNSNEGAIETQLAAYPGLLIPEICLIVPLCEELTYRQGLFEAVRRYSRVWAYIVITIAFGLLHTAIGSISAIASQDWNAFYIELLSFPSYAIGGGVLAWAYERNGDDFFASFLTHAAYNTLEVILIFEAKAISQSSSSEISSGLLRLFHL